MYLQKHGVMPEKVVEKTENSLLLEFNISENCDFFDGHFPQIQLLPAVAQIDIVMHLAQKYFGISNFAASTKRTKFVAPVFPNTTVRVDIKFNSEKNTLTYKFMKADEEKTYSTGTFTLGAGANAS